MIRERRGSEVRQDKKDHNEKRIWKRKREKEYDKRNEWMNDEKREKRELKEKRN